MMTDMTTSIQDLIRDADVDTDAATVTFRVEKGTDPVTLKALTMRALGVDRVVLIETRPAGPRVPGRGNYGEYGAYVTYGVPGAPRPDQPRTRWGSRGKRR